MQDDTGGAGEDSEAEGKGMRGSVGEEQRRWAGVRRPCFAAPWSGGITFEHDSDVTQGLLSRGVLDCTRPFRDEGGAAHHNIRI